MTRTTHVAGLGFAIIAVSVIGAPTQAEAQIQTPANARVQQEEFCGLNR